jgi:hypothetical protein
VGRLAGVDLHGPCGRPRHMARASCLFTRNGRVVRHAAWASYHVPWPARFCAARGMGILPRPAPRAILCGTRHGHLVTSRDTGELCGTRHGHLTTSRGPRDFVRHAAWASCHVPWPTRVVTMQRRSQYGAKCQKTVPDCPKLSQIVPFELPCDREAAVRGRLCRTLPCRMCRNYQRRILPNTLTCCGNT